MNIKVLKKFYEYNKKRSNLFFRLIQNRKITSYFSRKYKARMYKTNITDSSDELNQLANLLSDSYSLEVLKMLVKARKKTYIIQVFII